MICNQTTGGSGDQIHRPSLTVEKSYTIQWDDGKFQPSLARSNGREGRSEEAETPA